jgi:hypothetical protein
MGKRDELDVVAVCRQEEETHTPKRLAPVTNFFFFFFFFGPAAAAGSSHNISIQEVSHAKIDKNCTILEIISTLILNLIEFKWEFSILEIFVDSILQNFSIKYYDLNPTNFTFFK